MLPVTMLMIIVLVGCGDYKTSKGSEKSGVANVMATITPADLGTATPDIDVWQSTCSQTGNTVVLEKFTDATASVAFKYEASAGCLAGSQSCPSIYLESFTVSFSSPDPAAVPISTWNYDITQKIDAGAGVTLTGIAMMPIALKDQYVTNGGNPGAEVRYFVTYTFHGKTEFGDKVEAKASTYILLSEWCNCPSVCL